MRKTTKAPRRSATPVLDGDAAKAVAAEGDKLRRALRRRIRKLWAIPPEERQVRCQ